MKNERRKGRETVFIVATGGTIEALHYPNGTQFAPDPRSTSVLPELLSKVNCQYPYEIAIPFMKDSRFMKQEDLELLFETLINSSHKKVLIAHGTMTIYKTHAFLKQRKEFLEGKTIVIFGAKLRSDLPGSDAQFNLAFALGCCLYAEPNVYIAMNGLLLKSQFCTI